MFSLIVTTRDFYGNKMQRFINSLNLLPKEQQKKINLILVVQSERECRVELSEHIARKVLYTQPCSLSRARNLGLDSLLKGVGIVAFPDDDCWYNVQLLPFVEDAFEKTNADFLAVGIYDPIRGCPYGTNRPLNHKEKISVKNSLYLPVEAGLFIKYSSPGLIKRFDERFGLGTNWGSGEGTDVILQMLNEGKQGIYDSHESVYHEFGQEKDSDAQRAFRYAVGFGALIAKSVLVRGQTALKKELKKLKRRNLLAALRYAFNHRKCKLYLQRLKGLRKGYKQGKRVFTKSSVMSREVK